MVVMVVLMPVAIVVVIVVMMVMVALALRIVALLAVVVMVMMVLMPVVIVVVVVMVLVLHLLQLMLQAVLVHGLEDLRAAELLPRGGDEACVRVEGREDFGGLQDLLRLCGVGAAHDEKVGICDLVVEELAEVAHVHFGLARVHHGDLRADAGALHALNRGGDIGELADARGLDENAVGGVVVHDLPEGLGKVAHQRAADTAGIHLRDLNARVLQEAAVNGDFAELVLDQHELFLLIAFRNQLADEGGFSRAEKARENVYSCHGVLSSFHVIFPEKHYITLVNGLSVRKAAKNAPCGKALPFIHKRAQPGSRSPRAAPFRQHRTIRLEVHNTIRFAHMHKFALAKSKIWTLT